MTNQKSKIPLTLSIIALGVAIFALDRSNSENSGATPAKKAAATFEKILRAKTMSVCYVPWPPSIIKDPNSGKLSGFLVDMIERVGEDGGFTVNYVESSWGGFGADLQTGKCDAGIAAFYPLINRSTAVSFTRPFYFAGNNGVVRADEQRISSVSDLNSSQVRIAVLQGEYGHVYSKRYFPKAELIVLDQGADNTAPLVAVSSGQADVGLIMDDVIEEYVKRHPEVKKLVEEPYSATPVTWSVRRNDQQLLNFLNNAINYLEATGELDALAEKYDSTFLTLQRKYQSE